MSFDPGPDMSYGSVFRAATGVLNGDIPSKETVCSEEAASASTAWQWSAASGVPNETHVDFQEGSTPP